VSPTYRVTVRPAADRQLDAAIAYYVALPAPEAARALLDSWETTLDSLDTMPARFRRDPTIGYRRVRLPNFPYLVWYRVIPGEVQILALTHAHMGQTRILDAIGHPTQ
jgi:plasmid stabilization system protein ParE